MKSNAVLAGAAAVAAALAIPVYAQEQDSSYYGGPRFHRDIAADNMELRLFPHAEKAGKKNPPLVYVFVVKGKTAYGTPISPDVNAQAVPRDGHDERVGIGAPGRR